MNTQTIWIEVPCLSGKPTWISAKLKAITEIYSESLLRVGLFVGCDFAKWPTRLSDQATSLSEVIEKGGKLNLLARVLSGVMLEFKDSNNTGTQKFLAVVVRSHDDLMEGYASSSIAGSSAVPTPP